jgi:mono/diheme cytochrome c family protein
MNKQEQQEYLEKYNEAKKKGVPFYPDILFKDAVISLLVFLVLVALAYFIGAPLEERANPADSNYTPRPEWYFLFLFQLMKRFPGQLEVIGVIVLPSLALLLLILLPVIDRSKLHHPSSRMPVMVITAFLGIGIIYLTVQSIRENPPPVEAGSGDQTAALYASNCAACHGANIIVPVGTNLHEVIANGKHEGMPSWSSDLTASEIDALAGFILSPAGNRVFLQYCGDCHAAPDLVADNQMELKKSIDEGQTYPPHATLDIPDWFTAMNEQQRIVLLNFLVAPDGQRLFVSNCSACHGKAVSFTGNAEALREIISTGGQHLEMPAWQGRLSDNEIDLLAKHVNAPTSNPAGEDLFKQNCASCHGVRIPEMDDVAEARQVIASGGAHQEMPVWGDVLTAEQLDALVSYTLQAARGTPLELGQELFGANCSTCHGSLGEGGINPTNPHDIIAPISSAEYLRTRDDLTLRLVISQGQPNFGMSPFSTEFGGPLEGDDIDAIVAFMRSWEANPPVDLPPEVRVETLSLQGSAIYGEICAQCHGANGEGAVGPSLVSQSFRSKNTDQDIFNTINLGHEATAMIGWGDILSAEQIQDLVKFIRELGARALDEAAAPSFINAVLPLFEKKCNMCHGTAGGWDGSSYESVMTSGEHGPTVIPGDVMNSLLAQKLLDTQIIGGVMPPGGKMPDSEIQTVLDWITAGAFEE